MAELNKADLRWRAEHALRNGAGGNGDPVPALAVTATEILFLLDEGEQLRAEVETLRKDAARWQCVRNAIPMQSPYAVWREGGHVVLGKAADEVVDRFLASAVESSANG